MKLIWLSLLAGSIFLALAGFRNETAINATVAPPPDARALAGAWKLTRTTDPGRTAPDVVKIIAGNSFTFADYDQAQRQFIGAGGGTFTVAENNLTETLEYFTPDSARVGTSLQYTIQLKGQTLTLTRKQDGGQITRETWQRLDDGRTPMAGAWRIRERANESGQLTAMPRGPRKTIKWLSGTRFQWAAINPETKQFFGTGGGTYTVQNGRYTETIEFFSRDPQRVGRLVSFEHELKDSAWHHRGLSTAGNKIYEVWAKE